MIILINMKVISPIYWKFTKKKSHAPLSLNEYRNTHFRVLNKVKEEYTQMIQKQLTWEQIKGEYLVCCDVYLRSTAQDMDNFTSVAIKFTLDALVKAWVVEWDSNKHLREIHSVFCGIDKENPRIEIEIL